MWLTHLDWKSLVPENPMKGANFPLPEVIANRLARFHLVDNTRGEPPHWRSEDVRSRKLNLTIEDVSEGTVRMRLEGAVLLATDANVKLADRGFDVRLLGDLQYDRQRQAFERIDIVALGDHWGEGHFTQGARPGKSPLGIVLELSHGGDPADQVPPQGAREIAEYLGRGNR
jgi:hypothetical protein